MRWITWERIAIVALAGWLVSTSIGYIELRARLDRQTTSTTECISAWRHQQTWMRAAEVVLTDAAIPYRPGLVGEVDYGYPGVTP